MTDQHSSYDDDLRSEPAGSVTSQTAAFFAWLLQACLFAVAMVFRYSGELGGWLYEYLLAEGSVAWRPQAFDWPDLPLAVAILLISIWVIFRNRKIDAPAADIGHIGTLLCLTIYALSDGTAETLFFTIVAVWLCAIVSASFHTTTRKESYTAAAAAVLLIACLTSAYMHVQHGCSLMEGALIILSAVFGALSTGMRPSLSRSARLALPAWFTLILLSAWLSGKTAQPSMRVLVMLELSAAFIAARHFLLAQQQKVIEDPATTTDPAA